MSIELHPRVPGRVRLVQGRGRHGRPGGLRLLQRGQLPAGHALVQVREFTYKDFGIHAIKMELKFQTSADGDHDVHQAP